MGNALPRKISISFNKTFGSNPLENFFGQITQHAGRKCTQLLCSLQEPFKNFSKTISCQLETAQQILTLFLQDQLTNRKEKKIPAKEILEESEQESIEVDETDYKICLQENAIGMNALTYVAGYLLKKSLLKHSCEMCRQELVNN